MNMVLLLSVTSDLLTSESAGALLGSLGVGEDPVLPGGHSGVHSGVSIEGASVSPADHSDDSIATILLDHHGATTVSLAGVLATVSSADVDTEGKGC